MKNINISNFEIFLCQRKPVWRDNFNRASYTVDENLEDCKEQVAWISFDIQFDSSGQNPLDRIYFEIQHYDLKTNQIRTYLRKTTNRNYLETLQQLTGELRDLKIDLNNRQRQINKECAETWLNEIRILLDSFKVKTVTSLTDPTSLDCKIKFISDGYNVELPLIKFLDWLRYLETDDFWRDFYVEFID